MAASVAEQDSFVALQKRLNAYAKAHGFSSQVQTVIERRGLVVRVLTDKLLFDSGQATLQPKGMPLLEEVAQLLNVDKSHPITVEGNTDNQPIATTLFPSNWELSTARATTVVRFLIAHARERRSAGSGRLRRSAPDRHQRHRRRASAEPARRHRADAVEPRPSLLKPPILVPHS